MNESGLQKYINKYFLDHINSENLFSKIEETNFHIFGATGALGLSFLVVLKEYKIIPKSITLYVRPNSNLTQWIEFGKLFEFSIKIIKSDSFIDINVNNIDENSTVLYLAGYAQPALFMNNPGELFDINITALKKIINRKPGFIFYSSTTEIYSGLSGRIQEDTHTLSAPSHPRGAYIESKRCAEALLYHCSGLTKSVSFRIALASPPYYMNGDKRILSDLISKAISKNVVELNGGWDSLRQYQWGPLCVLKMLYIGFFGSGNLYNIAGGEIIKLSDLGRSIADKLNVIYIENRTQEIDEIGAPKSVIISTDRLENDLGFKLPIEKLSDLLDIYLLNIK